MDSPSHPKRPLETFPGNQREEKHRKFAGQAEHVFPPILIDGRLADPRINMHKTNNGKRKHGKCAGGKRRGSLVVATQQRRYDHEADAEEKDNQQ